MSIVLHLLKLPTLLDQERTYLNTLVMKLFSNNFTPVATDTLGAFTVPADTGLLLGKTPVFAVATLNGLNEGELIAPTLTWTASFSAGALTIYGYFVYDPADNTVVYSERAVAPFPVTAAGQTYSVTPRKVMDTM